jgi:hypothetical protein
MQKAFVNIHQMHMLFGKTESRCVNNSYYGLISIITGQELIRENRRYESFVASSGSTRVQSGQVSYRPITDQFPAVAKCLFGIHVSANSFLGRIVHTAPIVSSLCRTDSVVKLPSLAFRFRLSKCQDRFSHFCVRFLVGSNYPRNIARTRNWQFDSSSLRYRRTLRKADIHPRYFLTLLRTFADK